MGVCLHNIIRESTMGVFIAVIITVMSLQWISFAATNNPADGQNTVGQNTAGQNNSVPISDMDKLKKGGTDMNGRLIPDFKRTSDGAPISISAQGVAVYCENTGRMIYSKNLYKQLNPYSITKLMTALIVVQSLPMDSEIVVSKKAAAQKDSRLGIKKGECFTVEELLYGMMLRSGNDAAYALGEAVSGDMESFVERMNRTAENIGCRHTHFVNPHGIKDAGQKTSASDFMKISRVVFSNETILKIAGATSYKIPKTNKHKARVIKNKIKLLKDPRSGIFAAKTGYWSVTDCSIAAAYRDNGLELYIVLLGDNIKDRTSDLKKLIGYAKKKVRGRVAVNAGKEVGRVNVKRGARTSVKAYTASTGYAYLPPEGSKKLIKTKTVFNEDVEAPLKKGDTVGYCKIYVGDELVNQVPVIVEDDVKVGWILSNLGISNMATVGMLVTLLVIIIMMMRLAAKKRKIRQKKARARRREIERIALKRKMEEEDRRRRGWYY